MRGLRRWLVALVVLAVLFVVADRVVEHLAAEHLATDVQHAAGLGEPPAVTFEGFPFLTQVLRGRYQQIVIRARDVTRDGLTAAQAQVVLDDVRAPLGAVLAGDLRVVTVGRAVGAVTLTYPALNRVLAPRGVSLAAQGSHLEVTGHFEVAGVTLTGSAQASVVVRSGSLRITPTALGSTAAALPEPLRAYLLAHFTFVVDVPPLPLGLTLSSLAVTPTAVVVTATAQAARIVVG